MRAIFVLFLVAGCAPSAPVPVEQIPKLESLKDVMHVQAKAADPQFKKLGSPIADADWPGIEDTATRLSATAERTKAFTQGPGFDKLADELHAKADELTKAAQAKDAAAAQKAIADIRGSCKACHKEYK